MVVAQAKFTVSVYNSSSLQTPGMIGGALAGGSQGAYGYYPPISSIDGQSSAVTGPGGFPTAASPYHGLGHMTNIQVPATVFPNSNFTIVTVFTYSGADVAGYSTRITIPGLGVMNNMSQSASVQGGGAATVQNTIATPTVLPYGPVTGTVELVRNGGVLTVDDVQPITINSPGGLAGPPGPNLPGPPPPIGSGPPPPPTTTSGSTGSTTSGQCVQTQACMVDAHWDPIQCKCVPGIPTPPSGVPPLPTTTPPSTGGTSTPQPPQTVPPVPPTMPVPPLPMPPTPGGIVINVAKGMNASRVTLIATGSGFHPGERVLISIHLDHQGWQWRRWNRHNIVVQKVVVETASAQGQVQHTFLTNLHAASLSGVLRMNGLSSRSHVDKDFEV